MKTLPGGLTVENLLLEMQVNDEAPDEMAACFNLCLLQAKTALEIALQFAPCTGPESSVMNAIEAVEAAKL